ncbi:MAG: GNAT family N-acetyltransferase, partial [Microcella sp.]|nr:GNAT family N-acetyltransferase [Microcella sp.]
TLARRLAPGALTLLNDADRASRRLAPPRPHHVLVAVGVDAAARGLGVGRLLVEHAVQRARTDSLSWGVRLETENPQNVDRYSRWGFSLLGVVPTGSVDVHVMARATTTDEELEESQ